MSEKFKLSSFESTIANYCCIGDLNNMGSVFLHGDGDQKLHRETVVKALEFVQARHPFLRAYLDIRRDENNMFMVIMNEGFREKIELDWREVETRQQVIELAGAFNAKLFKYGEKQVQILAICLI